ncbi:hypothetical protein [Oxalobacter paraformigenes]|uniref:hypothetical protein n=1 Tax=Oxalobacter paraformigenes TaxID=556268 RepID=UPI0002E7C15B|nr:hypothetical protein [Oxalobacter paraformigenes]
MDAGQKAADPDTGREPPIRRHSNPEGKKALSRLSGKEDKLFSGSGNRAVRAASL